jgi:predicted Zn-dependent peptidase
VISDKFINTNNTLIRDAFNLFEEVVFDRKNITSEILEKEKKIYIESFESKIANVYYSSGIVLYDTMFDKENYHNHLDSNIEEINKVTLNSLNEAYDLLMSSAKFCFVIGDLNEDVIGVLFKNTPNTELSLPPFIDKETKDITKTNIQMVPVNLPQSMLLMGYRTDIRVDSKNYFAMCLLNKYLGGGFDSLFIKELREKYNLVYTIGSEYDWYKGIMIINCGINYDDYETVVDLIKQCIDDIKNKIIDKELLSAIKKQMISEQMEAEDNLISLIEIVNQKYFYQNKIISNQKKIDKINNVTEEDIIEVAKSLLLDTIVLVGKE